MKRSLIILFAAAVTLVGYACAPQPPAPPPQSVADCSFPASKVVTLQNNFNVRSYAQCQGKLCTPAPAGPVAGAMSAAYAQPIANAINTLASPRLRADLCTLDKIYIDQSPTSQNAAAWGMRDINNNNVKFIGLSAALLADLSQPPTGTPLAWYESYILGQLLAPANSAPLPTDSQAWLSSVAYTSAITDSPSLAMLGVLAHEMGHIVYVSNENVIGTKCSFNNKPFFKPSWRKKALHFGFHQFGNPDRTNPPKSAVNVDTLQAELQNSLVTEAQTDLVSVYGGGTGDDAGAGEWASLFSTVAVDEDFVETYKLMGLSTPAQTGAAPALTSLVITIPTATTPFSTDVITLLNDTTKPLNTKKQWIEQCISAGAR
jgi:hypothetical protein